MKRKTYNNVVRAVKLIKKKGYNLNEANEIALNIFKWHENDIEPIEFYIDKVLSKEEWEKECR